MRRPVVRNPQPSLLRSLMSDHLDPGYEAAARARHSNSRRSRRSTLAWTAAGTLLIGVVFGTALTQVAAHPSEAPGIERDALDSAREASARGDELDDRRNALDSEVDRARTNALRDGEGSEILADLRALQVTAGATPVTGPGITVVVSEPPSPAGLSDASARPRGTSTASVLDRDLQVIVNSLWASGAEAVAIDDVRIGPNVTIRQAGGAMLVDNRPVFAPYEVSAIGSPTQLQARFSVSDAYLRMSALSQLYRVGFDVRAESSVDLPAAPTRPVSIAHPEVPN